VQPQDEQDEFTPGPWEVRQDFYIATCEPGSWSHAEVKSSPGVPPDRIDEHKANARLIAAAPDLLAACRSALAYISICVEPSCDEGDVLEDGSIHDGSTAEGNLLRDAITKATGAPA
jgi:hypothetical protein